MGNRIITKEITISTPNEDFVAAKPVSEIFNTLYDNGYAMTEISRMTGVPPSTVGKIRLGQATTIGPSNYRKIMTGVSHLLPDDVPAEGVSWPRADECQVHLRDLMQHGFSLPHIAFLLNVSVDRVQQIRLFGDRTRVDPVFREAILGIEKLSPPAANPLGAARRFRALVAWGHNTNHIANELQVRPGIVDNIIIEKHRITQELGENIASTFSRLEQQPGRCNFSKKLGEQKKWPIPFQWDEYSIDTLDASILPKCDPRPRAYARESREEILQREIAELTKMLS